MTISRSSMPCATDYSADVSRLLINSLRGTLPPSADWAFAAIRLNQRPVIVGKEIDRFFYAASLYKLFVAAETLRQIDEGRLSLHQPILVDLANRVSDPLAIVPREEYDGLEAGRSYSLDELLRQMLANSSNTAANVLIDLVTRESINKEVVWRYGWHGSEVTRKFLAREREDAGYRSAPSTQSCCRHIVEFLLLIHTGGLLSENVSNRMKRYMQLCRSNHGLTLNPSDFIDYYHKFGSFEMDRRHEGRMSAIKALLTRRPARLRWQHDAGVATIGEGSVALCILTKYRPSRRRPYFPVAEVGAQIVNFVGAHRIT